MTNKLNPTANIILQCIRVFVGILFIFSGLIKANDPSGLAYKMHDFFELWGMHGLSPAAMTFSIAIITFEIVVGVALLVGYAVRISSILLLLLMVFFTFLTGYAVWYEHTYEKELACGCFGDCIPLKAIQSFWKDIILLVLVIILLFGQKYIRPIFNPKTTLIVMIGSLIATLLIQWYALRNLPYVDCLPYKPGNNIVEKMQPPAGSYPDEYATTYFYKNTVTGEEKAFPEAEFVAQKLWEDSTWVEAKEAEVKLIKKGNNTPEIIGFKLTDFEGEDNTDLILSNEDYSWLWMIRDINTVNESNIDRIKAIAQTAEAQDISFYLVTSSDQKTTDDFLIKHGLSVYTTTIDPTTCKTIIRTNPGLILMKNGTIEGKWSYTNYPKNFEIGNDKKIILK